MKKALTAIGAVGLLCAASAWAQAPSPSTAPIRIGVVNQDKVLNDSEEGKRLKSELEKLRAAKSAAIDAKEKEIKLLQDQLLNAQLSLSEERREEVARQLKRRRVEYERLNDDAGAEMQEAITRAQARLIALFREIIAKYGAEKGYTVIIEKGALYYSTGSVDVTDELLVRFNAASQAAVPAAPPKN